MRRRAMELNRETAMRLWNKAFGNTTRAVDFTYRVIDKGAYGDRNSDFGWNVDHILPVSHGGKTNDSNLIITHIKTNDEKADKFPCFTANEKKYEIIKVQNHYEIKEVDPNLVKKTDFNESVNFLDSAAGVRLFKKLKGIQNKPRFVGTVLIRLKNLENTAVVDFIEQFLDKENISYSLKKNYYEDETRIVAKNYNMPRREDIGTLLDKCVLLNTYLSHYFCDGGYISDYDIRYQVNHYKEKEDMYLMDQKLDPMKTKSGGVYSLITTMGNDSFKNTLLINNLVIINTEASNKVDEDPNNDWTEYNFIYTNLAKGLKKEVSR